MDILFSDLKKKDVIDVNTGKKLGKVRDITVTFPEGRVKSISVAGGMLGCGEAQTVDFKAIERIGSDAVLVNFRQKRECCPPSSPHKPPKCADECRRKETSDDRHFRIDEEDYE